MKLRTSIILLESMLPMFLSFAISCSYVLSVLDQLIVDDYTIVYLHSGAPRNSFPSIPVLHRFYKNIDRRYF